MLARKRDQQQHPVGDNDGSPADEHQRDQAVVTVTDLLTRYIGLQHRVAVLKMLESSLKPYLRDDTGNVTKVVQDRSCIQPVISAEAFDEIWLLLRDARKGYEKQMEQLAHLKVEIDAGDK